MNKPEQTYEVGPNKVQKHNYDNHETTRLVLNKTEEPFSHSSDNP